MIHVNPGYLSTMEYREVKMRCIDLYQALTTTSRAPLHRMWKHWNDGNFRLRKNGTSIKTPATKVVQNTKVKVVSYTRWTRRGPPRFPDDIRDLFLHLAETSLSLWISWVSFVTRKNHFLQDQSCQSRPRKVSRLIVFTNIRPLSTTSARIIRH